MARRKGRNRKKKNRTFNKKKFRNVYCPQCGMCDNKTQPTFCYNTAYKSNPSLFTMAVFPNLIDAMDRMTLSGRLGIDMTLEDFSDIFCKTGVCTAGSPMTASACPSSETCFKMFKDQVRLVPSKAQKKRKKKQKRRAVYVPYASFFCRDDETFKAKMNSILYGDNDNEQDKDQELSDGSAGDSDRPAEDRKS